MYTATVESGTDIGLMVGYLLDQSYIVFFREHIDCALIKKKQNCVLSLNVVPFSDHLYLKKSIYAPIGLYLLS